jgi:hypothetical protein
LGLVEKANRIDNFLNERYLEKEFTQEWYDFNGSEYDGVEVNLESYIHTIFSTDGSSMEVNMVFKDYQVSVFKTALDDLKESFVDEYITAYIPLAEKIAFGTSLKRHLEKKLEKFRNKVSCRKFAPLLSDFIIELSIQFVDVIDSSAKNLSFCYSDKLSHRVTLNKLYGTLIFEGLISKETEELHFLSLFQNKEIENPVAWTGNVSELKYFIEIINRKELHFEDKGTYKWRIAVKCFVKVSSRTLKKITYTDLRTYKITNSTRLKLDYVLVKNILSL